MTVQIDETAVKLGFGLMRLPRKFGKTDIKQTSEMVDMFMENGFNYFDTAHIYPGSEQAAGKALVSRYPRESFALASKLFVMASPTEKSAKKQLETTLKKTKAGYLDYYLLHFINKTSYGRYERLGLWDYIQERKQAGDIKHIGFSFHDDHVLLDKILTEHPEVEFVQLQINYADWENKNVESRANYEVARKHGVPIVVMEPIKGGKLANPPKDVAELLKAANPDASFASWALRFVASLDGILSVLSGMSTLDQMRDNVSFMRDFKPLDAEERKVIQQAQELLGKSNLVPCTECKYCVDGCPKNIQIPAVFNAMNMRLGSGLIEESKAEYKRVIKGHGKASDCIECGACNRICTQKIDVVAKLAEAAKTFD